MVTSHKVYNRPSARFCARIFPIKWRWYYHFVIGTWYLFWTGDWDIHRIQIE